MKIELLIKNLISLNLTDLDEILDKRDQPAFDDKWISVYELLGEGEALGEEESIFKELSIASNNHEICSYIIDDFRLIQTAEKKKVKNDFVEYLLFQYSNGKIPNIYKGS